MTAASEETAEQSAWLSTQPRSVALVGNAPGVGAGGEAARIDAADWVVRFNNAPGFGREAGSRVTHLALVNHGGQMREWLEDPAFTDRPAVRQAGSILFPFARKAAPAAADDEDGRDWTDAALVRLRPLGKAVDVLPEAVRREAAAILRRPDGRDPPPSTGFLVALHLVRTLAPSVAIAVHGFGFAGWSGHCWAGERRWFEAMERAGRLRLHPPAGAGAR